jgi:hypothetical protein
MNDTTTTTTGTTGTTGTTQTTGTTTTTTTTEAPWYTGKVDGEFLGHAQNNGWDKLAPADAAAAAIKAHREAQKMIGVPANELLRIPKPSSPTNEIDAFWGRLGAVKDAKDIDLSGIKSASGEPLDPKVADVLRNNAIALRAPKDVVTGLAAALQKHFDAEAAARAAEHTTVTQEQQAALDRNWGKNKQVNMVIAQTALERIGQAAGLTADQITAGWDALSKVGGIGASYAMQMLLTLGQRMSEDTFKGGGLPPANGGVMSREQALAEIADLKKDKAFAQRIFEGNVEDKKRWSNLHKIAYGQAA